MAKHILIFSTICCTLWILFGEANGIDNVHVEVKGKQRTRRDVAEQIPEGTEVPLIGGTEELNESNNNNKIDKIMKNFDSTNELNLVKRAPSGFTGMRGKKENNDVSLQDSNYGPIDPIEYTYNMDEDYNDAFGIRYKKAPSAFYGVRGKKFNIGSKDTNRLDSLLQQFEEQRLREVLLEDFIDRLATATVSQNEINKRAPTGFTGMRGKRPSVNYGYEEIGEDDGISKRGPSNAFVGVRGKKDVDHQTYKRAATQSLNSRGKKQRFVDFGNKFVAVRGKKNELDSEPTDDVLEIKPNRQRYYVNILPSLLYDSYAKRTPSGFVGMRGKRAAVDSNVANKDDKE
ncbi:tachykinins-like isoform X2 [Teleopsis dalmanni]|uniref:tachykinins isoform X2 n=1 Tax=Teleopsis dalmanni TaxID=139649 RepID=UPI000D32A4E6|nr:tachykinins isoform X2 [Teleopsis dalmanni]XP_037947499.1 tachykinins-like isoform X2 [Teleopsis dalmanni]